MEPEPEQQNAEEPADHKSLNHNSIYYSYVQRYYTSYESETQYVRMHSNGLFLVGVKVENLASTPVKIEKLLEAVEVRGKKKKGGVRVKPNTHIAHIICENGEITKVQAKVEGTVIEYNDKITPQKLGLDEGYIIIIMPNRKFIPEKVGMKLIPIQH